ncbi:MAG: hypothetical protein AAF235_01985, partial [Planctomycetota bacterium]
GDPDTAAPSLDVTTDLPLDFDLVFGTLRTDGRLVAKSETFEFVGTGVNALVNEARRRLDNVVIRRGERITLRPPAPREAITGQKHPSAFIVGAGGPVITPARSQPAATSSDTASASQAAPVEAPAEAAADQALPPGPVIDYYTLTARENIRLIRGEQTLDADELTAWLRVIDGAFPEPSSERDGARQAAASRAARTLLGVPIDAALQAAFAQAQPRTPVTTGSQPRPGSSTIPQRQASDAEPPVTIELTGPIEITHGDTQPSELDASDAIARFTATRTGAVSFRDTSSTRTARGSAGEVWYDDTARRVDLRSPSGGVLLEGEGTGRLTGVYAMSIDTAAGTATVQGGGEIQAEEHGTPTAEGTLRQRSVTWSQTTSDHPAGARFTFDMADGNMTGDLDTAEFTGTVIGRNDGATLVGTRVQTAFEPTAGGDRRIALLSAETAGADDGNGAGMEADTLTLRFAPGTAGEDIDPTRLIATGAVTGRDGRGGTIDAGYVNARLARDGAGDVIVTHINSRDVTRFRDAGGRAIAGATVEADILQETATLTGTPAAVTTPDASIRGATIDFDGKRGIAAVTGEGSFRRGSPDPFASAGDGGPRVDARWSHWMRYDDQTGLLECSGGAVATTSNAPGTTDTLIADFVTVTLEPAPEPPLNTALKTALEAGMPGGTGAEGDPASADRAVILAEAESLDGRASIERERIAFDSTGTRRVEELYRLEGPRIELDNTAGRVDARGAGTLLLVDQRARDPFEQPAERDATRQTGSALDPTGSAAGPGQTLIDWSSAMSMQQATGRVGFVGDVRVVHRALGDASTPPRTTVVFADTIDAEFDGLSAADVEAGRADAELRSLVGNGRVLIRGDGREVEAGRVTYNARTGIARASAGQRNSGGVAAGSLDIVTIVDLSTGSRQTARSIEWDLVRDRIDIERPGPVVVPTP